MAFDLQRFGQGKASFEDMSKYDYILATLALLAAGFISGVHNYQAYGWTLMGGHITVGGVTLSVGVAAIGVLAFIAWGKYSTDFDRMFEQKVPIIWIGAVAVSLVVFVLNSQFSNAITSSYGAGTVYALFVWSGYLLLYKYGSEDTSSGKLAKLLPN